MRMTCGKSYRKRFQQNKLYRQSIITQFKSKKSNDIRPEMALYLINSVLFNLLSAIVVYFTPEICFWLCQVSKQKYFRLIVKKILIIKIP